MKIQEKIYIILLVNQIDYQIDYQLEIKTKYKNESYK